MNCRKECLITLIEDLRRQLDREAHIKGKSFCVCEKTYALSLKLDELIYQYMKQS